MQPRLSPYRLAVIFVIYAIAISWICWLPVVASYHQIGSVPESVAPLLVMLGTFGPFLAAVSMVSRTGGVRGLKEFLGQAFRWRVGLQWYAAALLAPALIRIVVLWVHVLKGGTFPDMSDTTRWLAVPSTFFVVLLIGGPTGEEFGWRGFLLQRLQPRLGMVVASLAIGLVTTIWHLPLFWIPTTPQSQLPFLLFGVRTVALSVISTWLYNGTRRSVLFVLLFHASLNTWPNTLNILQAEGTLGPYISTTIIYAGWAAQLMLLGLLRGSGDRRRQTDQPATVAA
jgi:uncharacterized protein